MSEMPAHAQIVALDPEPIPTSETERLAALIVALDDRLRGIERFLGLDLSGRQRVKRDLSVKQAAFALGNSATTIKALCKSGRLPGTRKIGGRWRIPVAAVKAAAVKA